MLLAVVLGVLLGPATPASAHAALLRTTPGDAEILEGEPREVSLVFGEPVSTGLGSLKVLDPSGERADAGAVTRSDGGTTVHLGLRPGLPAGTYLVAWRVVSADSHPVSGTFTFSVGTPTSVAGYAGRITQAPRGPSLALGTTRLLGYAALLVLLGGSLFCLLLWPAGTAARAVRRLLLGGALVELLCAAAALLLQGPYAAGLPLSQVGHPSLLSPVLSSRYGQATLARVVVSALAVGLALLLRRLPARPGLGALAALGAACALTWTAAGHAGTSELQPFTAVLDVSHLLAVSAWLGGLCVLLLGLRGRWDTAQAVQLLPGWSRVATWSVVVLVVTGLFASWRQVRTPDAVFTAYVGVLALKSFVVVLMLLLGNNARLQVRRAVEAAQTSAGPGAEALPELRRSVRTETGMGVVVVALTAVLVQTPPAASAYAPPYTGTSAAGPLKVQVDLYPARKGVNGLHLYVLRAGRTVDVAEVTGTLHRSDGESLTVHPGHKSLGHYEDLSVVLPAKGPWTLDLQVRVDDVDSFPTRQQIEVR